MRQLIDKWLLKLPIFIFISWLVYFFILFDTEWYTNNQKILDRVDTVLVFITVIHAFFFLGILRYDNKRRIIFLAILLIVWLQYQYLYNLMNEQMYLRTYKTVLISTIATIFLEAYINRNKEYN